MGGSSELPGLAGPSRKCCSSFGVRFENQVRRRLVVAVVELEPRDGNRVVEELHGCIDGAFNGECAVITRRDRAAIVATRFAEILEVPHPIAEEPAYRYVK